MLALQRCSAKYVPPGEGSVNSLIEGPHHTMSVTNPYPVDSATRTCCGGIGRHTRECSLVVPPPGAHIVDDWESGGDDQRVILGHNRSILDSEVYVGTACIQHRDGHIDDGSTGGEGPSVSVHTDSGQVSLNSDQARILAALLLESAALVDGWVQR